MKVVALVQARMGSTRLPGKVLLPLYDQPMLGHVVSRLSRSQAIDEVVVATSTVVQDDQIVDFCGSNRIRCFRGDEHDVLHRFYQAAHQLRADTVVRVTADCPLIDPVVVDEVVQAYLDRSDQLDHVSNVLPRRTFPRGLDTEVFGIELLDRLWVEDQNPAWRQHVTEMVFQQPERFQIHNVVSPIDFSHQRWTVDTPEDLRLITNIFEFFGHRRFGWQEVLAVTEQHPEWLALNRHVRQKAV